MINREQIYLAALLHDIGKFYQRADENSTAKSTHLSEEVKNLEKTYCPLNPFTKRYSHKHVLWTAQFFIDFSKHLKTLLGLNDSDFYNILKIASIHHNPSNSFDERIIQKADHYSSGIDRSNASVAWKDSEEEEDKNWDNFKRIQMRSIFEGISIEGKNPAYNHKLPLLQFQISENYFPKRDIETIADYKKLWNDFATEVKFIQSKSIKVFNETLLFLLEKYTSRIPGSTQHLPDVSLFHHLKSTAALAISLYDYKKEHNQIGVGVKIDKDELPFALIGGDLSGIQKFIYNIIAKGAAKNLKGRSFYLQLLVDNIVQSILDHPDLQLFSGNIIYSSGGSFYILAPNKKALPSIIETLEKSISEKLFGYHKTELFLALDYVPFGEDILYSKNESKNLGELWKELSEKLSTKKSQRFKNLISTDYDKFFVPINDITSNKRDAITGEELLEHPAPRTLDDNTQVNDYTYQLIELGKKLKSTDYWIQSKIELTYFNQMGSKQTGFNPIGIGYFNYFINQEEFKNQENKLRQSADNVRVLYFNKNNFLEPVQKGIDNIYGLTLYGGNDYPADKYGEPKTFEEIAGAVFSDAKKTERISSPNLLRLGVLRMDVDNLGRIFRDGFKVKNEKGITEFKGSFSRYCTLSSSLDYFFKGYLNSIWESKEDYKEFSQIIYSGGDDLFIVGKWDVLINMAFDIKSQFKKWTCNSSSFTLSGGMAIVGAKYPILKSALQSEAFEKAVKNHIYNGVENDLEKNAFAFLGYDIYNDEKTNEIIFALNWDTEYEYVHQLKENIKAMLANEKEGLSQGFSNDIYNLMQQGRFYYDKKEDKYQPANLEVIWQIAYNFKRRSSGIKNETQAFLKSWVSRIMTGKVEEIASTKYHALQILAFAARWAAFEIRSEIN